jgi:hypothetical protein
MEAKKRTVIVHCHMFKNAGTSFDWSLQRCFGNDFLDHRDDENMKKGAEYLGPFLQKHSNIKAISSHHIRFPLPELPDTQILPAFILRHPIDRVGSVYSFERKQKAQTPGAINAKKMSFKDYVLWRMESTAGGTIRNFQTRSCLDKPKNIIREADFEFAQKRIKNTPLVCIVDNYDDCMVLFEVALRPYFPDIDLSYVRQNVTKGRESSMDKRINNIFVDLGLDVSNEMLANNHWDLMLYLEAKKLIDKLISTKAQVSDLLDCFQKRCQKNLVKSSGHN